MAYPTTEELVGASESEALASLSSDEQDALRAASIAAVEEYCGQAFEDYVGALTVQSGGGERLYLPRRLRSFTDAAYPSGTSITDLSRIGLDPSGSYIYIQRNAGLGYYEQAMLDVSGERLAMAFPYGQVVVTGEWGWTQTPPAVERALRLDMEEQAEADANGLSATVHAYRKLGLRSIAQGNLTADLGGVGAALSPRVAALLEPYVWSGNVGALA